MYAPFDQPISNNNRKKYIHKVPGTKIKLLNRQVYQADIGSFTPWYLVTEQFEIIPFELANQNIRDEIINSLNIEFPEMRYNENLIRSHWDGADVFYLIVTPGRNELIGSIAIDRHNFYPCISQVFIKQNHRNHGYARTLINFIIDYVHTMGLSEIKLWCNENLIPFYTKLGWIRERKHGNVFIMSYTT